MNAVTRSALLLTVVAMAAPASARADDARVGDARKKAADLYPPCTKKPSEADLKGAKGAHTAAKQFLELGRYDKAIASWNDAYTFDCSRPSVFYNLGNAYERNGDKPMTIAVLEIAIARDPEADKSTLQAKIDNLEAALAAEPVTPKKPDVPASGPVAPLSPKPGVTDMRRPFGPVPWITLGVGGAILVSGIPVLIIGRGKVSDAEKQCPTHKLCTDAVKSQGNTGNTMTGVGAGLIGGGGAIAIASLVWQFAGNAARPVSTTEAASAKISVVPTVSPSLAGAMVTGSF